LLSAPLSDVHLEQLDPVVNSLAIGGMGLIPTDTQNAYITSLSSREGMQRIYAIKGIEPQAKKPLSLLCSDMSMAARFCDLSVIPGTWFAQLDNCLPGPFTVILQASKAVPKVILKHKAHTKAWKRREVGIRIPDNALVWHIVEELNEPLLSSSACQGAAWHWEEERSKLDFIVACDRMEELWDGIANEDRISTVIDLTLQEPILRRQGMGDASGFPDLRDAAEFE